MRQQIFENIVKRVSQRLIAERKSDKISLLLSRLIINQFKKNEDFEMEGIQFERGDDYANFDLRCYFIKDEDFKLGFLVYCGNLSAVKAVYFPVKLPLQK